MSLERLQKVLAHAGVASRRRCEELILAGAVRVNGRTVTALGTSVDPDRDVIEVHGRRVQAEKPVYILLYKPAGYVSTADDPRGRPKVTDLVRDIPRRLYPVGRLDYDTEGLLLLTNDGELAYRLTHPRFHVPKTYLAEVEGRPDAEDLARLASGVPLEDGMTAPARILLRRPGPPALIELTIHEGRNRQVRRMCAAVGHPVRRLRRIRFAFLEPRGLSPGKYRHLTAAEVRRLHRLAQSSERSRIFKPGEE
ncbi:MAG: pseudouridine synthase [Thermoanaerobacterales bacterium]|nr:pseudouridine synthase [Bacillota bacterium]MDI6906315.1 pseudouridine synthase [Thermoanaerobacterales bacterium]